MHSKQLERVCVSKYKQNKPTPTLESVIRSEPIKKSALKKRAELLKKLEHITSSENDVKERKHKPLKTRKC